VKVLLVVVLVIEILLIVVVKVLLVVVLVIEILLIVVDIASRNVFVDKINSDQCC